MLIFLHDTDNCCNNIQKAKWDLPPLDVLITLVWKKTFHMMMYSILQNKYIFLALNVLLFDTITYSGVLYCWVTDRSIDIIGNIGLGTPIIDMVKCVFTFTC